MIVHDFRLQKLFQNQMTHLVYATIEGAIHKYFRRLSGYIKISLQNCSSKSRWY